MIRELWLRIKRFILPYPLAFIGKYSVRVLLSTCKIDVQGLPEFLKKAANGNCIMLLWHNRMSLTCEFFRSYAPDISYVGFLSKSRDGEPIARIINSYKNAASIRVAHDTKHNALKEVISRLRSSKDLILITPDGPRGPREMVKKGVVLAAKATGASIIPYTWEADRYWQLGSWDRFRMPKPFSKIRISLGNAINLPEDIDMNAATQFLEASLKELADDNSES